jgi:hypothetical protein
VLEVFLELLVFGIVAGPADELRLSEVKDKMCWQFIVRKCDTIGGISSMISGNETVNGEVLSKRKKMSHRT